MHCLGCQSDNLQVVYTRKNEKTNEIARRRVCNDCGLRFTTTEYIKPRKIKKNDRNYLIDTDSAICTGKGKFIICKHGKAIMSADIRHVKS